MAWKDSLGNVYREDPGSGLDRGQKHKAKPTHASPVPRKSTRRKLGRKIDKYARYRSKKGKPNGPGQPGNKSGHNKIN